MGLVVVLESSKEMKKGIMMLSNCIALNISKALHHYGNAGEQLKEGSGEIRVGEEDC